MDLIIGSGVSGLSYANFCGHDDYLIIEKDKEIGGYCKTIKQDGFTWDYSGHFFHFRNKEIKDYLIEKMNKSEILDVVKHSQIYYKYNYIDFPFQKNIHQLSKEEMIDCLYDLFFNEYNAKGAKTFKEMIYKKFGKSIAEKFLIPYNEKLYACDLNFLDKDAMGRFFPFANKEEIIKNFRNSNNESYNSHFTYPKGGAIEYVNSLYSRVNPVNLSLEEIVLEIDLDNKNVKTNKRLITYDRLISSIPFVNLLDACKIDYDQKIYSWNQVLVFNLGFDKKGHDIKNHWVYFPDNEICFYRIGYYDNIFNDNRLSLYVEIGFDKDKEINSESYLKKVLNDLQKTKIITDHNLISYAAVIMNPAYVHINNISETDIKEKIKYLNNKGVFSIGRYGGWKYCSIEDNIIEAKELAGKIN